MSTILLTGANGFVGQHLGAYLVKQGHQVIATSRRDEVAFDYTLASIVKIGVINAKTDWKPALAGVEVVIHLAARVHIMRDKATDPFEEFLQVNTQGTKRLAEQAAEVGVKRFIYLSTIKVNGEGTISRPFCENDSTTPEDPYALSKWEAERGLLELAAQTGLEVSIIRPPLVYGSGVGGNFQRLLGLVAKAWPLPLAGVCNQRSLVGVNNLCNIIELCTRHPQAAGQVFLVSDGQDISTPELFRMLAKMMHRPYRLWPLPTWLLAVASQLLGQKRAWQRLAGSLQIDISKAQQLLDWEPPYSLEQGLADTVEWYQKSHLASK